MRGGHPNVRPCLPSKKGQHVLTHWFPHPRSKKTKKRSGRALATPFTASAAVRLRALATLLVRGIRAAIWPEERRGQNHHHALFSPGAKRLSERV